MDMIGVFQFKPLCWPSSLPDRFIHTFASNTHDCSKLPTLKDTGSQNILKVLMSIEYFKRWKIIKINSTGKGLHYWANVCCQVPIDKGHVKETWQAKADQNSRDPLNLLEHLPPNQNLSYYFVPFTNSSDISRGLSPTTFLWKKST